MTLTVKVILKKSNGEKDVRRFLIDNDQKYCCYAIKEKIRQQFPQLGNGPLEIQWEDEDGDFVTVTDNEAMSDAIGVISQIGGHLRLHVKGPVSQDGAQSQTQHSRADQSSVVHNGVTCDECEGQVVGIRYKCGECVNYDLCEACKEKGVHSGHSMYQITTPLTIIPRNNDRAVSINVREQVSLFVMQEEQKGWFSTTKKTTTLVTMNE